MKNVLNVSGLNFEAEVLKADRPVVVDFWAQWCGPCKMLSPLLDQVAEERPEVKVVKVNVDENPELAGRFNVRSIPTLIFVKDGVVREQSVGLLARKTLTEKIAALTAS